MNQIETTIDSLIRKAQITPYVGERQNAYSLAKRLIFKNNLQNNYKIIIKKSIDRYLYLFYQIICPAYNCKIKFVENTDYLFIGYKNQLNFIFSLETCYMSLKDLNLIYLTELSSNYIYENLIYWIAGFAVGITYGKSRVNSYRLPYTPMGSDNYCRGVADGWKIIKKY